MTAMNFFFENVLCSQNFPYRRSCIYKKATPNSIEYIYLDDKSKPAVKTPVNHGI